MSGGHFTELRVDRAPGYPTGGPRLTGLGPGLQIVVGPNASGKSTLARSALALLAGRNAPDATSCEATAIWQGATGARPLVWRRNSFDPPSDTAPAAAVAVSPNCLFLPLLDLLTSDPKDFRDDVARQLAGGLDLGALRRERLEPASSQNSGPYRTYNSARAAFEQARNDQAGADLEQRIAELTRQLEQADAARRTIDHLRYADRLADRSAAVAAAQEKLGAIPDTSELRPADANRLSDLRSRLAELRSDRRRAEVGHVPARGFVPGEALPSLTDRAAAEAALEEWKRTLQNLQTAQQRLAEVRARAEQVRAAAAGHLQLQVPEETAQDGGVPHLLTRLEDLCRRKAELDSRRTALESWDQLHPAPDGDPTTAAASSETLLEGQRILSEWLTAPAAPAAAPAPRPWPPMATVALALGAAGLGLAFWHPVAGLVAGLPALLGLGWILNGLRAVPPPPEPAYPGREDAARRFAALELPGPTAWEPAAVIARHRALLDEASAAREREQRLEQLLADRRRVEPERAALERDQATWDADAAALRTACGAPAGFSFSAPHLLDALRHADSRRRAEIEARAAEAAAEAASTAAAAARSALQQHAAALGLKLEDTLDGATGQLRALAEWMQREHQLQILAEQERGVQAEFASLLARAGLPADSPASDLRLDEAMARVRQREEAAEALRQEKALLDREMKDAAPEALEFFGLAAEQRQQLLADAGSKVARSDEWRRELEELRTKRNTFATGDQLLRAATGLRAAHDGLLALRDELTRFRLRSLALDWIEQRQRDRMPELVHRANTLLHQFTTGRHGLHLGPDGSLQVSDTSRGSHLGLDQLSSGTRAQVLLALRLAQGGERARALPLLLDESLAQADPIRADAAMRALLTEAKHRQLLVFTAQPEEAARWRAAAAGAGVACTQHSLGDLPSAAPVKPASIALPPPAPAPGETPTDYAARLAAAGFAPAPDPLAAPRPEAAADATGWAWWTEEPGILGLPAAVIATLVANRLLTHGNWRLAPPRLRESVVPEPALRHQLDLLADAWRRAILLWREGPSRRPLHGDDFREYNLVTDKWHAEFAALAGRAGVRHDPARFLAALQADRPRGFGGGKLNDLREDLLNQGFLADAPPVPLPDLEQRLASLLIADGHPLDRATAAARACLRWLYEPPAVPSASR